jgi:prepilin-type N-terminal cleavage/methylation domain-containing protein
VTSRRASGLVARGGFTAVELMMVMGIMLIIMSITVPAVLPTLRHGKLSSAVNDIQACWRKARGMAMATSIPSGTTPYHYGILISQPASGETTVSLVYDNENVSSPKLLMFGEDPSNPATTYNAGAPPVAQYSFNRNVLLATASASGGALSTGAANVLIYAQYGTGLPISPVDVAGGRGLVAAATSLGVSGMLATNLGAPTPATTPSSVMPVTELMTSDFVSSPRRGFCIAFAIFHAGFVSAEDL